MLNENVKIDSNHFVYKPIKLLEEISNQLIDDNGIGFLSYICMHDDGSFSDLCTNRDWTKNYFEKYLSNPENQINRMTNGFNYWKKNSTNSLTVINEDARNNFDIDARIEFVYRDEINKCSRMYSFFSNRKNADKAYSFYDIHRGKLLKFITHFHLKAKDVILEAEKKENLCYIPEYTGVPETISKIKRNYASELKAEGSVLKLSDREFETMLLYAGGASAKQIAYMFDRSTRTVETHMQEIRRKTGNADRLSMHKYIIENGWGDLIRFFFPYIPAEAA